MQNEQMTTQLKIQKLDDTQLVKYFDKLISYDRKLNQTIILALGEIQQRRLYMNLGYSNLFEMLLQHFKMSETAAYQRLNTLKLIKEVPEVHNMIETGNLSLTNAAMAQSVIHKIEKIDDKKLTVNEKQEIVQLVCNKTQKQAQVALTEIHPVASLPKTIEKPITADLTQVQVVLNKDAYENLQTLKSLYSHKIPDGDMNKIFELLISIAVQNHQINKMSHKKENEMKLQKAESKKIINSVTSIKSEIYEALSTGEIQVKKTNQTRHVRISVKRNIYQRANGQCEFRNQQGQRCQSRHQLEFDHIQSVSHGGDSQFENIQLLCRYHNQMKVKNTHGFLYVQ